MDIWEILNINETTDIKEIRHAYSVMSKQCHPESEPEKFQQLYQAYQKAMNLAKASLTDSVTHINIQEEKASPSIYGSLEYIQEAETEVLETKKLSLSIYDKLEHIQKPEETQLENSFEQKENCASLFDDKFFINLSPIVQTGFDAFRGYFELQGEKDWKEFVTKPEFLRVQFDEIFVKKIAEFLKMQTMYPLEKLPYDMVKELYFCYYSYMSEQADGFFEDGFTELFKVLSKNEYIDRIEELYQAPAMMSEVVKYKVYYGLYKAIEKNGADQRLNEWNIYIADAAREMFVVEGQTSYRDKYLFCLLAFLIEKAPVLPSEIYRLLIEKLELYQSKSSSKYEMIRPLCQAILSKGINISEDLIAAEMLERRQLMKEIEKIYFKNLTDADRPMLQEFFGSGLFYKHRLDGWLLDYRLVVFAWEHNQFPKVFLEEYLNFYDKIYAQTGSNVGMELYHIFSSFLNEESSKEKEYKEVTENKQEWLLQYFFEEGFTRVWTSNSKGAMRVVYRGILTEHMTALAEQHNYEWDLWSDGHLLALKDGDDYIFSYDKVKEKVTLQKVEYYHLLEEMLELYMGKYFVTSSEKNTLNELKERAREAAYGNDRN